MWLLLSWDPIKGLSWRETAGDQPALPSKPFTWLFWRESGRFLVEFKQPIVRVQE